MSLGLGKLITDSFLKKGLDIVGKIVKDKDQAGRLTHELQTMAKTQTHEIDKLVYQDRKSARQREVDIKKSGGTDFMMIITGLIGLSAFAFMIYALAYLDIPKENKELFIHAIGIIEGVAISMFGYYFGSSKK